MIPLTEKSWDYCTFPIGMLFQSQSLGVHLASFWIISTWGVHGLVKGGNVLFQFLMGVEFDLIFWPRFYVRCVWLLLSAESNVMSLSWCTIF